MNKYLFVTRHEKSSLRVQNFLPTFSIQNSSYTAIEAQNESAGALEMFLQHLKNILRTPADSFCASMVMYEHFCEAKVGKKVCIRGGGVFLVSRHI